MNSSLKRQLLRTFSQMISDLKNPEQIEGFLTDFLSEEELIRFVKRISIAYWIKKGRDEENIKRNLGATTQDIEEAKQTITKRGVKMGIKYIEADEWANVWTEKIKRFSKNP